MERKLKLTPWKSYSKSYPTSALVRSVSAITADPPHRHAIKLSPADDTAETALKVFTIQGEVSGTHPRFDKPQRSNVLKEYEAALEGDDAEEAKPQVAKASSKKTPAKAALKKATQAQAVKGAKVAPSKVNQTIAPAKRSASFKASKPRQPPKRQRAAKADNTILLNVPPNSGTVTISTQAAEIMQPPQLARPKPVVKSKPKPGTKRSKRAPASKKAAKSRPKRK